MQLPRTARLALAAAEQVYTRTLDLHPPQGHEFGPGSESPHHGGFILIGWRGVAGRARTHGAAGT